MRTYEFYQLDVFTQTAFTGNPLAVFPDATGIYSEEMQKIALEMNLSETVFVLPSEHREAVRRLRIFTPTKELPMAGHPVVGTWNLLAQLGFIENAPRDGSIEIKHELGIGVLPVELEFAEGKPSKVTMTQGDFAPGEVVTDEKLQALIAEAFNFTPDDFAAGAPVQVASSGMPFTIIPLRSLEVLKNTRANAAKLEELPKTFPGEFSLFTFETFEGGNSAIHTRMYAPEFGITEDPATGSAAGTLGGYLAYHDLLAEDFKRDGMYRFTIEQGDFMRRPSRINVEITGAKGSVEKIRVGGASVIVAKGEMYI